VPHLTDLIDVDDVGVRDSGGHLRLMKEIADFAAAALPLLVFGWEALG
jgi:hypothetical protein